MKRRHVRPWRGEDGAVGTSGSWFRRLDHKWSEMQVGRQGKYSVERLESLDHYCCSTSTARAVGVCVATPLPALATVVLIECMPLQPPSEGWKANWVFWIRLGVIMFVLVATAMLEFKGYVPGLPLSRTKAVVIAGGVTVLFMSCGIAEAIVVGFPVPFMWQLGSIPVSIAIVIMVLLTVGRAPFTRTSTLRSHLHKYYRCFCAYGALVTVYPVFKVLYDSVPTKYQGPAILLLPVWKFGAKKIMGNAARDFEDFVPEIVAFSVDFFSTLFVSVCMFSSGSVTVSVLVIAADVLQAALEFREVRMNANAVETILQERHRLHDHQHYKTPDTERTDNLLTLILAVARNPRIYNVKSLNDVELWACLPHPIPGERVRTIEKLQSLTMYSSRNPASTEVEFSRIPQQHAQKVFVVPETNGPSRTVVQPVGIESAKGEVLPSPKKVDSAEQSKKLVVQGLQLLFHCEYLTLVEYVECVVPLVFVVYKSVLHQLPNVAYFPGENERWHANSVGNIILFSALEIGSFVGLNILLRRKFGFSPLCQLAFVLETQFVFVQAKIFMSIMSLMPYEVEHLGTDFSFQFEWLHKKS